MLAQVMKSWTATAAKVRNLSEFEDLTKGRVESLRPHRSMTISAGKERVLRMPIADMRREHLTTRT
jgi:hypothetical protein